MYKLDHNKIVLNKKFENRNINFKTNSIELLTNYSKKLKK